MTKQWSGNQYLGEPIDSGTDELICVRNGRVAIVMLNKPAKKNALGDVLTPALRRMLAQLDTDDRVGCVMLTGAGDAFCSGGDVSGMGGDSSGAPTTAAERIENLAHKQATLTLRLYEMTKITVAALPGVAAGAGLSIALACDLRIATAETFITTAFRNIGLSGDYGASWFLPRLIGEARAKELFYTARRVPAAEALAMGLFNQTFPTATFREEALTYAQAIAQGPSRALARMKENLNCSSTHNLRDALALEASQMIASGKDPEAKEAISAFMQKRPPEFHRDLNLQEPP